MMFPARIALSMLVAASIALPIRAWAADVAFTVTDQKGRPVEDAVIVVDVPGFSASPRKFEITQKDATFVPHAVVAPVGSTVEFGNLDPFRHHVYSFSPARKFELKLFGRGQVRPVRFDKPGVVAVGCNIHDSMQAFIVVVQTRFAAKSGPNGRIVLRGVPAGSHKVRIWHSRLRAPGNEISMKVDTSRNQSIPVKVRLRSPAPRMREY